MTALYESDLPEGELLGMYPSDAVIHPDDPRLDEDPFGLKEARGDADLRLHNDFLFDDASTVVPNEATGLAPGANHNDPLYNLLREGNLSLVVDEELAERELAALALESTGEYDVEVVKRRPHNLVDELGDIELNDDELGEMWMRGHDPTNPNYDPKNPIYINAGKARPRVIN